MTVVFVEVLSHDACGHLPQAKVSHITTAPHPLQALLLIVTDKYLWAVTAAHQIIEVFYVTQIDRSKNGFTENNPRLRLEKKRPGSI